MIYCIAFGLAFVLAVLLTPLVIKLAYKLQLVDSPRGRHQHQAPTPLLGGLAIFIAFFVVAAIFIGALTATKLNIGHWLGVLIGASLLMIGGYLDDRYDLKPWQQVIWPILASLSLVVAGVGIEKLTNPLGGFIYLDLWRVPIITIAGETYYFTVLADLLVMVWVLAMTYTTKLLDGLDGLVTGLASIAALVIFVFTQSARYFQPDISLAAITLAGAALGFLIYNWNPAKVFLGEGGSMLLGFLLGVLSIISGAKIAIALLIMGLPILDLVWTVIRRIAQKKSPFSADRQHLHFVLLDRGLGVKKTVGFFYLMASVFGVAALVLQSRAKLMALGLLVAIMLIIIGFFYYLDKKRKLS